MITKQHSKADGLCKIIATRLAGLLFIGIALFNPAQAFETINELRPKAHPRATVAAAIGAVIASQLKRTALSDAIVKMRVTDVRPPHKVAIEFSLLHRLEEPKLYEFSQLIRKAVGARYKYIFVGFETARQNFSGNWASADHKPNLQVSISGLRRAEWDQFVKRTKAYRPARGESVLAHVLIGGYLARQVLLVKRGRKVLERVFEARTGDLVSEKELTMRNGRYWLPDSSFKENYRLRHGKLEIHDQDGLIRAYNQLK